MTCAVDHFELPLAAPQKRWYLYQVRDPGTSAGAGFDSYIGITENFDRRKYQHLSALKRGRHPNKLMQAAHNASENGLQVWLVAVGTEERIRARERLFVDKPNKHWNRQIGGGTKRGICEEGAQRLISGDPTRADGGPGSLGAANHGDPGSAGASADGAQTSGGSSRPLHSRSTASEASGPGAAAGVGIPGAASELAAGTGGFIRTAIAGAGAAAAGLGIACAVTGGVTAAAMNKTVLKDDMTLEPRERSSRRAGRIGSGAGAVMGTGATMLTVGAMGTVPGLSTAGVAAGLAAVGGGSLGAGAVVALAAPAIVAAGVGYGVYRLARVLSRSL